MGTRRLRDFVPRTDVESALLELQEDRRRRAGERFGIPTFESIGAALEWRPDALVISTPPDAHEEFVRLALEQGYHHFSEANLWTYDNREVEEVSAEKGLVSLPSCSLHFLPIVKELRRVVSEDLGDLHCYQFCLSTYLPSWHPGEGMEFYARHRSTAAGREMVPFELLYLNHVFGTPLDVGGTVSRRGRLEVDSEDTWCLQMRLESGGTGQLMVSMGCPQLLRRGWAAGANGIVHFDITTGEIRRELPGAGSAGICDVRCLGALAQVLEDTYSQEINAFIDVIQGRREWPHSYYMSAVASGTLAAAEKSAVSGRVEKVDPGFQPARLPDMY